MDLLRKIKLRQPFAKVIVITDADSLENTVDALRVGTVFLIRPLDLNKLQIAVRDNLAAELTTQPAQQILPSPSAKTSFGQIIGQSPVMKELISMAKKVAASDVSSVLLQGESGTGKDILAKAIHYSSTRADKPLVSINCAAIPANLIESELFGYEKGSFTDAKKLKEGLLEQARGGTVFLDEIGEMDITLQAKLLRVLEEGTFRRVGGLKDLSLNALVIAASNRNLREESEAERFRRDFYFRLSIIELDVPPLRHRGDDVLLLAEHFIRMLDHRYQSEPRRLAPEVVSFFRRYPWSGNVRELRNAIERALILEDSDQITLKYMPPQLNSFDSVSSIEDHAETSAATSLQLPLNGISLKNLQDSLIEQALERTRGNVTRAAKILNLSRDQLRYWLKKRK